MFKLDEEVFKSRACITVVGVGGGGGNVIKTMRSAGLTGVRFMAANTDLQALEEHEGLDFTVQMGAQLTGGLGAGANPEIGRQAAIESCDQIGEALKGANMVFVTAGMGGGTGTGAAGVIARMAKEQGALTVGVVTKPFFFEGQRRLRHAEMGIQFLKENVDTLIVIPNQKLLTSEEESAPLLSAFKKVDNILLTAVRGIVDLITQKGLINLDFADIKTIMSEKGLAIIGTGMAKGEERALKAGQMAISSPLLEENSFKGASGLIINIRGGSDLSLKEVSQVAELISAEAHPDAEIIFGAIVDPDKSMETLQATVIATGFEGQSLKEGMDSSMNRQNTQPSAPSPAKTLTPHRREPSEQPLNQGSQKKTVSKALSSSHSAEPLPAQPKAKLPRDILLEKAKAYQEKAQQKQQEEKDNQQMSWDLKHQKKADFVEMNQAPFKKPKSSLLHFFRKSNPEPPA